MSVESDIATFISAGNELVKRYEECDSFLKKHKGPFYEEHGIKKCANCFRRLKYFSYEVTDILDRRKSLQRDNQPCDAPVLRNLEKNEIDLQKSIDYYIGISKLSSL